MMRTPTRRRVSQEGLCKHTNHGWVDHGRTREHDSSNINILQIMYSSRYSVVCRYLLCAKETVIPCIMPSMQVL